MNISRNFMLLGSLYLLAGIFIGMYMGASGKHELAAAHAHINLLGFVLMTIFGLVYRAIPAMAASRLALAHFWLHQVGTLVVVVLLTLLLAGRITEAAMVPAAPIAEALVFLGIVSFAVNLYRKGH